MAGTEEDDGVRVIKSGTDFREFSTMVLELVDAPAGGVRRKLIKSIKGLAAFSMLPTTLMFTIGI